MESYAKPMGCNGIKEIIAKPMGFNGYLQFRTGAYPVRLVMRVAATSNPNGEVTSSKWGKGNHAGVMNFDKGTITARRRIQCRDWLHGLLGSASAESAARR